MSVLPTSMTTYLDTITVGRVMRTFAIMLSVVVPIWTFAGSYMVSLADEAIEQVLKKHGLDPETFEQVKKGFGKVQEDVDKLRTNDIRIESDLSTLKAQNRDLNEKANKIIELLTKDE